MKRQVRLLVLGFRVKFDECEWIEVEEFHQPNILLPVTLECAITELVGNHWVQYFDLCIDLPCASRERGVVSRIHLGTHTDSEFTKTSWIAWFPH